jgi:hypothetical protein
MSLGIPEAPVKRWKRSARADYPQVDGNAVCLTEKLLGCFHQPSTQAGTLARRIHGQQPNVPPIAAKLDVNAGGEACGIFSNQEFASFEKGAHAIGTGAVAIEDGTFNHEGPVNQVSEIVNVRNAGESHA